MLVDSHCHLDRLDFKTCGGNVTGALAAAASRDVSAFLCVCISEENKDQVIAIAEGDSRVFASVGVHPSDAMEHAVSVATLCDWADHPRVVALGETGLDYHYSRDSAEIQRSSFAAHLRAAAELRLPLIVHTREAREDTLDLIRAHGNPEVGGVLHCFTESWNMARQAIDLGYYISISGIVTFNSAAELRDVVRQVPLERLLVETDSPYLAPVPHRGKPNQPAYVREVAEFVAQLKGVTLEELAKVTTENFYRLFKRAGQLHQHQATE